MGTGRERILSVLALTLLLSAPALVAAPHPTAQVAQAAAGPWRVEQEVRAGDIKTAAWQGQEALWLRNNTHAVHAGSAFTDGTIEFDLSPMAEGDFFALTFRRGSLTNHENVYFRLSRS